MNNNEFFLYKIRLIEEWCEIPEDPLIFYTTVWLVSEKGYERFLELDNKICFKKDDPVVQVIMKRLNKIKRNRIYSILFHGCQNGLALIENFTPLK
jgi:hypothetical protein